MNTLEKLETFMVLAECGSFTEAAKRLYCSQPRVSHHLRQLEQQFETQLFYRSSKQVRLTKQGEILLQYAKQIASLVEEVSVKLKQEHVLSLYVSNYLAIYYFSDLLGQLHTIFPQNPLEIHSHCYHELIRSLQEGKTHFALMPIYPEDEYICKNFRTSILFEEELQLVLPANHPWAGRRVIYARDLHHATIFLPQSRYLRDYVTTQLEQRQVKVQYLQMSNFEMMKQAVKAQHGFAFLPYGAIRKEVVRGELLSKPIASISIKRKNGFVFRKDLELSPTEQEFCKKVEQFLTSRT